MITYFMRAMSRVLIVSTLFLSIWSPVSQASLITSEEVITTQHTQASRERIRSLFDRKDVREQLQAKGISADAAKARVDALTDDEVANISGKLDNLPAGGDFAGPAGDVIGLAVFVFIVLLITDILGFTKVFSFTRPIKR